MRRRLVVAGGLLAASVVAAKGHIGAAHATSGFTFGPAVKLAGADGHTESRLTVTPDDKAWVITNDNGEAVVYGSSDEATWKQAASPLANQSLPTIDVDIVSTRTGRLIGTELDYGGIDFRTSYSDDGGATWTAVNDPAGASGPTTGTGLADTDRPWLAVGPDDPTTHLPRVYMLFHNLASGAASHNMYVATSTDNGATFGVPIPVTSPGTQAFTDLQCADSGGPSNIFVNPADGRVYTVFGTRSSVAGGGCGASATGTFEVNVVGATRVWVASAPASGTADPTQWTQSLAVDDNATGQIVGMQLAPGAIDSAGDLYVAYPESPNPYPDYDGAAVKYVHATQADVVANPYGLLGPTKGVWSAPVTVAPAGGAGHLLPHIVAGGAGRIDLAYFTGDLVAGSKPSWYATAAQVLDALDPAPQISEVRLSSIPTDQNTTASEMMGACGSGPAAGAENGFACGRSTDVWAVAADHEGRFLVSWPGDGPTSGTYVAAQTDGPVILGEPAENVPEAPVAPFLVLGALGLVGGLSLRRQRRQRG